MTMHVLQALPFPLARCPSVLPGSIDPTLNLHTRYPLCLGDQRQCGMWSLPDTFSHDWWSGTEYQSFWSLKCDTLSIRLRPPMFCPSLVMKWVCWPTHTLTNTWGRLKWPSVITKLTAHFMCGLMSNLVIYKFRKKYSHTGHWMSLLRTGVIKQRKPNQTSRVLH